MVKQQQFPFDDDAPQTKAAQPPAMQEPQRKPAAAESSPQLITSGVIAAELNEPARRVRRILATRHDIRPAAFAGRTRLYTNEAIARVRHELNTIDARQCRREGGQ